MIRPTMSPVRCGDPRSASLLGHAIALCAVLEACCVLAFGCGGNVVGNDPGDASSVADTHAPMHVDAGMRDHPSADAATSGDKSSCKIVLASDYDQSCVVDTDCIAVGQVSMCPAEACDGCSTATVGKKAIGQYMAAFSKATAAIANEGCFCPLL